MVSTAVFVTPLRVAVIVTLVFELTRCVVTVNVRLVEPAEIVTFDGTVAADVLLLERFTTAPPLGAGALSVTVPVESSPPFTVEGFTVTDERLPAGGGGITVSVAVFVTPL